MSAPQPNFFSVLRVLASSWRRPAARPVSPALPMGLGVGTLPDGMHRLPLGVPVALVARDTHSAQLWFAPLLQDAVVVSSVFLLAPSQEWADRLLAHEALHDAHAKGRLVIWVAAPALQPLLRTQGLRPLFEELHSAGLRPEHAVFLMDAQTLLTGLDILPLQRVGEQLRVWCLQRQQPVVLGFCPTPEADTETTVQPMALDVLPMLHGLCNMTMHIATLSAGTEHSTLHFERWNGDRGAVFQTGFGLTLDPHTQRLRQDGSRTERRHCHARRRSPAAGRAAALAHRRYAGRSRSGHRPQYWCHCVAGRWQQQRI